MTTLSSPNIVEMCKILPRLFDLSKVNLTYAVRQEEPELLLCMPLPIPPLLAIAKENLSTRYTPGDAHFIVSPIEEPRITYDKSNGAKCFIKHCVSHQKNYFNNHSWSDWISSIDETKEKKVTYGVIEMFADDDNINPENISMNLEESKAYFRTYNKNVIKIASRPFKNFWKSVK